MSKQSFIYRHILIYRFIMDLLYRGKYKKRFIPVIEQLKALPPHSEILELCFGDIYIAEYCKTAGHRWIGLDINKHFIKQAQKLGFEARYADLASIASLPKADVCIIIGSLYHFHPHTDELLTKMFDATSTLIIDEPVLNLSSGNGVIGYLAKKAASVGKGHEEFRYNESSLLILLKTFCQKFNCEIVHSRSLGKDLIVKLIKNGKDSN